MEEQAQQSNQVLVISPCLGRTISMAGCILLGLPHAGSSNADWRPACRDVGVPNCFQPAFTQTLKMRFGASFGWYRP